MRRCLVHHPRRNAGARPVRLRDYNELDAAIGESPDYQYGLAAPGMERIVDPPLDRVFVGSLSLFREAAALLSGCPFSYISVPLSACLALASRGRRSPLTGPTA